MSSTASRIVEGKDCQFCLLPFLEPTGYPCSCVDCFIPIPPWVQLGQPNDEVQGPALMELGEKK